MKFEPTRHAPLSAEEALQILLSHRAPDKKLQAKYHQTTHFQRLTETCSKTYKTCVLCGFDGSAKNKLVVHHRHYRSLFGEDPLRDVTLLCSRCHGKHHRGRRT